MSQLGVLTQCAYDTLLKRRIMSGILKLLQHHVLRMLMCIFSLNQKLSDFCFGVAEDQLGLASTPKRNMTIADKSQHYY